MVSVVSIHYNNNDFSVTHKAKGLKFSCFSYFCRVRSYPFTFNLKRLYDQIFPIPLSLEFDPGDRSFVTHFTRNCPAAG
jgi:hypothetical protein